MRSALLFALALSAAPAADEVPLDAATGMKMAPGWEIVRNHCVICHSPQTFLRQRATEAKYLADLAAEFGISADSIATFNPNPAPVTAQNGEPLTPPQAQ
jgi:mono/diheme cytochrome c family protein